MALTLVKEDGTGLSTANSYANVTDGGSYHDAHSYATVWTAATSGVKEAALAMATRLIDDYFIFDGKKINDTQALEFPRFDIVDRSGYLIPSTTIPQALINAVCEYARWLISEDRTAEVDTKGFKSLKVGSLRMEVDHADRVLVVPAVVKSMLQPFARPRGGPTVKVRR